MATPKKIKAIVTGVTRYDDTVIEYSFSPEGRMPAFKPGQFLHLAIDPYDPSQNWPESRVFSIANAPESGVIRIVISVKGKFTARMAAELIPGSTVWLKFPYGNFTFDHPDNQMVLVAGGTGISPYISFLEHCLADRQSPPVSLYYGIREERFMIFEPVLVQCKQSLPRFNYTVFCENPGHHIQGGVTGIIDAGRILAENPPDADFYLSGPPLMIDSIGRFLRDNGVSPGRIFIDEW